VDPQTGITLGHSPKGGPSDGQQYPGIPQGVQGRHTRVYHRVYKGGYNPGIYLRVCIARVSLGVYIPQGVYTGYLMVYIPQGVYSRVSHGVYTSGCV